MYNVHTTYCKFTENHVYTIFATGCLQKLLGNVHEFEKFKLSLVNPMILCVKFG